jgi:hypothetical protein
MKRAECQANQVENFIAMIGKDIPDLPIFSFHKSELEPGRLGRLPLYFHLYIFVARALSGISR